MYVFANRLNINVRRIEKATASAADLWDARNGCLDYWLGGGLSLCSPGARFDANLRILHAGTE